MEILYIKKEPVEFQERGKKEFFLRRLLWQNVEDIEGFSGGSDSKESACIVN